MMAAVHFENDPKNKEYLYFKLCYFKIDMQKNGGLKCKNLLFFC